MIDASTSQPAATEPQGRDRLTTAPHGRASTRDFARVLQGQAQGRETSASTGGATAFGERGLLHSAGPLSSQDGHAPSPTAFSANEREVVAATGLARSPRDTTDTAQPALRVVRAEETIAKDDPRPVRRATIAEQQRDLVSSLPRHVPSKTFPSLGGKQQPRSGRGARFLSRAAAASVPLQIAVTAVEHGMTIRVAALALDDAERNRLADAIAELLSRHGYAAATVSVNGVVTLLPSKQGQDTWR